MDRERGGVDMHHNIETISIIERVTDVRHSLTGKGVIRIPRRRKEEFNGWDC